MTTLQEIEVAVRQLPKEHLKQFRQWFEEFDAQVWDEQFENDVKNGKLDALAEDAFRRLRDGECTEL